MLSSKTWQSILLLAEKIKHYKGNLSQVKWNVDTDSTQLISDHNHQTNSIHIECVVDQKQFLFNMQQGTIHHSQNQIDEVGRWIKLYLQTILARRHADKIKRAITIGHFAQTMDGKIATVADDSKWIGNEENLIHAHRMRALCDGIVVGRGTFQIDNPTLNVRHVEGPDPFKIVIGQGNPAFQKLLHERTDGLIVLVNSEFQTNDNIQAIKIPCDSKGKMDCLDILSELYKLGIHIVYIEGGASTTSNFLQSQLLDYLQIHISPILFGSGKDAFVLPTIQKVEEAISFIDYDFYTIGRAPMFAGVLNKLT